MKKLILAVIMGLVSSMAIAGVDIPLSWTDVGSETGYEVERKLLPCGVAGTWSPLATTGADVTTYVDLNRPYSSVQCYKVRGTIGVDKSPWSNEFQVNTPAQMGTPVLTGG